jgi:VIT family
MHLHLEHAEKHFTASDTVRDVVVGMSDGLTVPFALAAGISGAIAISHLVVTAGLAEIAAGSIAMGLSKVNRPVGSLAPRQGFSTRPIYGSFESPWLYMQSEALQDIPFHLHPGPSPPPLLAKIGVLGRCGGG